MTYADLGAGELKCLLDDLRDAVENMESALYSIKVNSFNGKAGALDSLTDAINAINDELPEIEEAREKAYSREIQEELDDYFLSVLGVRQPV